MQGKLMVKSKVVQSTRPKSQVFRKRIKPERASTPQRWSRRIRSLPPIPINVLRTHRKMKKKNVGRKQEQCTSTSFLEQARQRSFQQRVHRERRNNVFVNKNPSGDKTDSVEVVRIVPVVVYVKNPVKPNKSFVPEEIRVHINDNPTCQMVSQAIDSHIHKKIKQGKVSLGNQSSKKIKMASQHPQVENAAQNVKRKSTSRKKMLLYQ